MERLVIGVGGDHHHQLHCSRSSSAGNGGKEMAIDLSPIPWPDHVALASPSKEKRLNMGKVGKQRKKTIISYMKPLLESELDPRNVFISTYGHEHVSCWKWIKKIGKIVFHWVFLSEIVNQVYLKFSSNFYRWKVRRNRRSVRLERLPRDSNLLCLHSSWRVVGKAKGSDW